MQRKCVMPTKPENCERSVAYLRMKWREIQNDRTYLRVDCVVGDVEGLAAPQVLWRHRRGLLAVHLVREVDVAALHEPAQEEWNAGIKVRDS